MRVVKFAILIVFVVISGVQTARAEMPVNEYMNYDFMKTQGYSPEVIRLIELNKAKTFGEELPKPSEPNFFLARWWQKFAQYSDPADDIGDFGTHIIYPYSTVHDY